MFQFNGIPPVQRIEKKKIFVIVSSQHRLLFLFEWGFLYFFFFILHSCSHIHGDVMMFNVNNDNNNEEKKTHGDKLLVLLQ